MRPNAHAAGGRLVIVTHVAHYAHGNAVFAYGPYAREIHLWAELFEELVIAAPCYRCPPPGDALPLPGRRLKLRPQPETGGTDAAAKLRQLAMLPVLVSTLSVAMWNADAIHVRCPGNLGLLAALLAPLFSRHRVAKFAGQWGAHPGEAWSVRFQRWLLRTRWWNAPALVYGSNDGDPPHIVPFFTSVLDRHQMGRARRAACARANRSGPERIVYSGRLSDDKNVDVLLDAVAQLRALGRRSVTTIVGDGPARGALEQRASTLGIAEDVHFTGALPLDGVLAHYERADVLVLPSNTEGWPKVVAEAMAFGVVCIGPDRGIVPSMLADGRGIVIEPRSVGALVSALTTLHEEWPSYADARSGAAAWAQQYTQERLVDALRAVLERAWRPDAPPTPAAEAGALIR